MAKAAKWKWQANNIATLYLVLVACCLQEWQKITSKCQSVLHVHVTVVVRLTVHCQAANTQQQCPASFIHSTGLMACIQLQILSTHARLHLSDCC